MGIRVAPFIWQAVLASVIKSRVHQPPSLQVPALLQSTIACSEIFGSLGGFSRIINEDSITAAIANAQQSSHHWHFTLLTFPCLSQSKTAGSGFLVNSATPA